MAISLRRVRRGSPWFSGGSKATPRASPPVPWECGVACDIATNVTWDGRKRISPILEEQTVVENPVIAADSDPAVHTCVSPPEISGPLQSPGDCSQGNNDVAAWQATATSTNHSPEDLGSKNFQVCPELDIPCRRNRVQRLGFHPRGMACTVQSRPYVVIQLCRATSEFSSWRKTG